MTEAQAHPPARRRQRDRRRQAADRRRQGARGEGADRGPRDLPAEHAARGLGPVRRRGPLGRREPPQGDARAAAARPASRPTARSRTPTPTRRSWTRSGRADYDEIIISTHPETRSGWLRRDLVAARQAGHAPAGRARGRRRTATPASAARRRWSSPTRPSRTTSCCDADQARAADGRHRFVADHAAGRGRRGRSLRAPRARAAQARGGGRRRGRPGRPPGPVHGDQNAVQLVPGRRHHHLDVRAGALRLAARRPRRAREERHRQAGRARRRRRADVHRQPKGRPPDGSRRRRSRPSRRARRPPRAARAALLVGRRPPDARDVPLHHLARSCSSERSSRRTSSSAS